jgi:predicted Zn-ribbon and HTH transcriptional regulator
MTEQQKIDCAKKLKAKGLSLRDIGREMGISHTAVATLLERAGPRCEDCGAPMRELDPESRCGFCKLEAIEALAAPSPKSTFALWELRDHGHTADEVVAALRLRQGGAPVEKVAAEIGVPA